MSQPYPERLSPFRWQLAPAVPPNARQSARLREVADRLVAQGIAAARSGYTDEALKLLDQALRISPDHLEALLWRGGLSEPGEALIYLERAYALDPANEQVREGLAWARQRAGVTVSTPTNAFATPTCDSPQQEPSVVETAQAVAPQVKSVAASARLSHHVKQIAMLAVLLMGLAAATSLARRRQPARGCAASCGSRSRQRAFCPGNADAGRADGHTHAGRHTDADPIQRRDAGSGVEQ